MRVYVLIIMLVLSYTGINSQSCNCTYQETVKPASYYSSSDFNCHQYVRAFFGRSYGYGEYVPPASNSIAQTYSSSKITPTSDPGVFQQVTDLSQANVVVWDCDHSAVVLSNEDVLMEKVGPGGDLRKFELQMSQCFLYDNSTKFFKYVGGFFPYSGLDLESCCDCSAVSVNSACNTGGGGTDCDEEVKWYGTSIVLNTVNSTSNYFNKVQVYCNDANKIKWTKVSGNDVYHQYCSSSNSYCPTFYFYLNPGQSVTYKVEARENSTLLFTKNYTFYRTSAWSVESTDRDIGPISIQNNEIKNNTEEEIELDVYTITGKRILNLNIAANSSQPLQLENGSIYLISARQGNQLLETKKVFISDQGIRIAN